MCHLASAVAGGWFAIATAHFTSEHENQVKTQVMRNAISFTLLVGGIFLALAARVSTAQDVAPDALVKSVTQDVITGIRTNSNAHDPAKIALLMEATILAHFDFAPMTRLAMGRNLRLTSPEQQRKS